MNLQREPKSRCPTVRVVEGVCVVVGVIGFVCLPIVGIDGPWVWPVILAGLGLLWVHSNGARGQLSRTRPPSGGP